jgi:hypothetical protein
MSTEPVRSGGGSWAVHGCLFGSVALFAILLIFMIILAYNRFRAGTAPAEAPVSSVEAPALRWTSTGATLWSHG